LNNFKLALTMVLLKVRKDVKLTTLGGRLFQATATRSLKSFDVRWAFTTILYGLPRIFVFFAE